MGGRWGGTMQRKGHKAKRKRRDWHPKAADDSRRFAEYGSKRIVA